MRAKYRRGSWGGVGYEETQLALAPALTSLSALGCSLSEMTNNTLCAEFRPYCYCSSDPNNSGFIHLMETRFVKFNCWTVGQYFFEWFNSLHFCIITVFKTNFITLQHSWGCKTQFWPWKSSLFDKCEPPVVASSTSSAMAWLKEVYLGTLSTLTQRGRELWPMRPVLCAIIWQQRRLPTNKMAQQPQNIHW